MSQPDSSTGSGELNAATIETSNFDDLDIDICGAPVVVTWIDHDASSCLNYLSHSEHDHLTLQIHRSISLNTAFFQIKANVALKSRRDRTNVFLYIHPERIQTVADVDGDGTEEMATAKLSTSTYCLRFSLSRPPALIVPPGDLTPKHKSSGLVLDSLQSLAKQISFSVHLPSTTVAKLRLRSLCEAVSFGTLQSAPKLKDVASLYGGRGGRVIEHAPQAVASGSGSASAPTTSRAESPPSYDELRLSSPSRPQTSQKSGTKRRRLDSALDNTISSHSHRSSHGSIESLCIKIMERVESGFTELGSRLDRMDQRLTDLEGGVKRHADKLGVSIERIYHRSSEQVEELRSELDNGLYDVRKETEDIITTQVEDEMHVAREQLEDLVRDEATNIEQRLEDKLEESLVNAHVSLDFNWNR